MMYLKFTPAYIKQLLMPVALETKNIDEEKRDQTGTLI
jgi:hypothetical protein